MILQKIYIYKTINKKKMLRTNCCTPTTVDAETLNGLFNVTRMTAVASRYRQMPLALKMATQLKNWYFVPKLRKKESVKLRNFRFENRLTWTHPDEHQFMPSARHRDKYSAFAKSKSCFVSSV